MFGTEPTTPVVVERVLTRTIDNVATTSITVGATTRPDGYVANTWYVGIGPGAATRAGAGGVQQHDGGVRGHGAGDHAGRACRRCHEFAEVAVAPGAIRYLDLTDRLTLGQRADRALDDAAVRRADPASRARGTGPRRRVGRSGKRLRAFRRRSARRGRQPRLPRGPSPTPVGRKCWRTTPPLSAMTDERDRVRCGSGPVRSSTAATSRPVVTVAAALVTSAHALDMSPT